MKVVVVGGGKVGYYLTKTLIEHGHEPSLIEADKGVCHRLANDLDIPIICGDGTTIDVLEAADLPEAQVLISVTGQDENNLIACQLAKKKFDVPKVVAKVNNPKNAAVLKQLGVDIVISSTLNIAMLLEREVDNAAIKSVMTLGNGESCISEITLPGNFRFHGKKLAKIRLPEDCIVVSIIRGEELLIPRGNVELQRGDKILVLAHNSIVHRLGEILGLDVKK